jgi:hypothetical protein
MHVVTKFRDFGADAQAAAEAHLARCSEALWAESEGEPAESPACAPFCGCDTCVVREVLWAAWQVLDAYIDDAIANWGALPKFTRSCGH